MNLDILIKNLNKKRQANDEALTEDEKSLVKTYKRILAKFEFNNGEIGLGNIYALNDE